MSNDADTSRSPILSDGSPERAPLMRDRYHHQLEELERHVEQLGNEVMQAISASIEALEVVDVSRAKELIENDARIDLTRHDIDDQAFHLLATQQPTARDLRFVTAVSSVIGELERIGDYCAGIAKLTLTIAGERQSEPNPAIRHMADITIELLQRALVAFRDRDVQTAAIVWLRDDEVDDLYHEFFEQQIEEMINHRKRVRRGTYMLWVAHNIERMADRVTNIAEEVSFVATGDVAAWRNQVEAEHLPPGV